MVLCYLPIVPFILIVTSSLLFYARRHHPILASRSTFLILTTLIGNTIVVFDEFLDVCVPGIPCFHFPLLAAIYLPMSIIGLYLRLRRLRVIYELQRIRAQLALNIPRQRRKQRTVEKAFFAKVLGAGITANILVMAVAMVLEWDVFTESVPEVWDFSIVPVVDRCEWQHLECATPVIIVWVLLQEGILFVLIVYELFKVRKVYVRALCVCQCCLTSC